MIFAIMMCPITPDYIHEESYGTINMIKSVMKNVGTLAACFAQLIEAKAGLPSGSFFYVQSIYVGALAISILLFMKEIT
jgi:hypothetical protein